MAIRIESPEGEDALTEFLLFQDQVYQYRSARWSAEPPFLLPVLRGESPFSRERTIKPFIAREGEGIVARCLALVDHQYNRHWNERLGHVCWFEAVPDTRDAVRSLMNAACEWLRIQGAEAARDGYSGLFDWPYVIDDYELLPTSGVRFNPPYYHALLKDARFETEKGWVNYKIKVSPELVARWESAAEAGRRAGFEIVHVKDLPASRWIPEFTATFNDAFKRQWGAPPLSEGEVEAFVGSPDWIDHSLLAYRNGQPAGTLVVQKDLSAEASLSPGRQLADAEKLNWLGIGVVESSRGKGLNLAMAASAYLELVSRGSTYLSYTMVRDDNWPSRRTAEKLGATVCSNHVVYRRNFRTR
jgi:hypothetical protein